MIAFPLLKTGVVLQYPATRMIQNPTCVLSFLDGTEQRFPLYRSPLRKWTIRLDLLDENEMAALEDFFLAEQGQAGNFAFTDPRDGSAYPNCSLEGDAIPLEFRDLASGRTTLVVKENRG